jgi:hypothetical protein
MHTRQVFTSTGIAFNFLVFGSQAFMFRRMVAEGDSTKYTALPSLSLLLCMVRGVPRPEEDG